MSNWVFRKKQSTGRGSSTSTDAGDSRNVKLGLDWDEIYKSAIRAGIRPSEFWDLTFIEYSLIVEAYQETQKADMYRDLKNDYYTGAFSQASKPQEFYEEIIKSIDQKPQSGAEIFEFLKGLAAMAGEEQVNLDSYFSIPLKLTPEFNVAIFNYVYRLKNDTENLYQPDVALSIDGEFIKPNNGVYIIRSGLIKIKYENQVYTIIAIKG